MFMFKFRDITLCSCFSSMISHSVHVSVLWYHTLFMFQFCDVSIRHNGDMHMQCKPVRESEVSDITSETVAG